MPGDVEFIDITRLLPLSSDYRKYPHKSKDSVLTPSSAFDEDMDDWYHHQQWREQDSKQGQVNEVHCFILRDTRQSSKSLEESSENEKCEFQSSMCMTK